MQWQAGSMTSTKNSSSIIRFWGPDSVSANQCNHYPRDWQVLSTRGRRRRGKIMHAVKLWRPSSIRCMCEKPFTAWKTLLETGNTMGGLHAHERIPDNLLRVTWHRTCWFIYCIYTCSINRFCEPQPGRCVEYKRDETHKNGQKALARAFRYL